jgi:hypothetical protein
VLPTLPSAMKRAERALTGSHKNCRVWNFESQAAVSRFNQLCLCSSLFTRFVIHGTAHGRENQRTTGALALDDSVKRSRVAMFTRPANDSPSIFRSRTNINTQIHATYSYGPIKRLKAVP